MQRRAASHHGIEDDFAFQPTWRIKTLFLWRGYQLLEDEAKGGAAPARPPLVQVGVRPVVMLVIRFQARQAVRQLDVEGCINREFNKGLLLAHRPYL